MSKMTRKLIQDSIQSQMEQAVDCVIEEQYGAAQLAFVECAKLCQQLEIERQLESQPVPGQKQITLDIEP